MVSRPRAGAAHRPPSGGQSGQRIAKNEEEIEIDGLSDDEGAPGLGFGTIPNAQDVHVVAAALGDDATGEARAENGMQVQMHRGARVKQAGKGNGAAGEALVSSAPSPSSSSSSSSESSDDSDSDEALDVASYQDMKNLVDEMMGRSGDGSGKSNGPATVNENPGGIGENGNAGKEGNGRFQAPSHPQAHQELFDTSEATLAELRASLRSLSISAEEALSEAGRVVGCLEGTVVVQASLGAASECLAEGSILVTEGRTVLGRIEDIFGPVEAPMYVLMDPASLYVGGEDDEQVPRVLVGEVVWYVESLVKRIVDPKQLREVGVGEDVEIEGGDDDEEADDEEADDEEADDEEADDEGGMKEMNEGAVNDGGIRGDAQKATAPPRPAQHPNQQPRTIAEWQSQQQAASPQGSGPKPFKPVAFKKAYHK